MKKDPNPLVVWATVPLGLYFGYLFFFHHREFMYGEKIDNICLVIGVVAALFCIIWVLRAIVGVTLEIIGIILFIAKGGGRK